MSRSVLLKLAIFATGLSGIVAEYILSTLATYFLGDSVFQWTMTVSVMMFSMGIGSRISKRFDGHLLRKFLFVEFCLSVIVAFSSIIVYTAAAYTIYVAAYIYSLSILVGMMIGMEIPLVIRINDSFEELRSNVSGVMENDYYGSLAGGVFFAFVGLPVLGLTYTPFLLASVNLFVALLLLAILWKSQDKREKTILGCTALLVTLIITAGTICAEPIITHGEQIRYKDKVIYQEQSRYQKIVMTQWQDDYWLYINGNQQLSTRDEVLYHEPLVHPVMQLSLHPQRILVMGGGDGCAVREILKYPSVENITLVDLDPAMTNLGKQHPILRKLNKDALHSNKLSVVNEDGFNFLETDKNYYDVIIIDLPDPKTVELGRLYTFEFYKQCKHHLRPNGFIITQAGSPYYATKAFRCIDRTMETAGFSTLPLHNQILTLGEWGWVVGAQNCTKSELKARAQYLTFSEIETQWIDNEAMQLITSFGKPFFVKDTSLIKVNKIHRPVLYKYYMEGNWDLY